MVCQEGLLGLKDTRDLAKAPDAIHIHALAVASDMRP